MIAPRACTTAAFRICLWGCKAVAALIFPPPPIPPQLPAGFGALRLGEGRLGGAGGEERVPERLRVWAQGFCEAQEELNGCPRRAVRAVPALESRKHGVCVGGCSSWGASGMDASSPLWRKPKGGCSRRSPSVLGVARGCKDGAVRMGSALLRGLLPLVFLGWGVTFKPGWPLAPGCIAQRARGCCAQGERAPICSLPSPRSGYNSPFTKPARVIKQGHGAGEEGKSSENPPLGRENAGRTLSAGGEGGGKKHIRAHGAAQGCSDASGGELGDGAGAVCAAPAAICSSWSQQGSGCGGRGHGWGLWIGERGPGGGTNRPRTPGEVPKGDGYLVGVLPRGCSVGAVCVLAPCWCPWGSAWSRRGAQQQHTRAGEGGAGAKGGAEAAMCRVRVSAGRGGDLPPGRTRSPCLVLAEELGRAARLLFPQGGLEQDRCCRASIPCPEPGYAELSPVPA